MRAGEIGALKGHWPRREEAHVEVQDRAAENRLCHTGYSSPLL